MAIQTALFETDFGWGGLVARDGRICYLSLPHPTPEEARSEILGIFGNGLRSAEHLPECDRLTAYFAGESDDLSFELDYSQAGDFDISVWETAREIPYGETRTYAWIADRIGRPHAARAVGQALGRNPIPVIVPCHRVLRSDGALGGFSAGLHWKVRLLELERRGITEGL